MRLPLLHLSSHASACLAGLRSLAPARSFPKRRKYACLARLAASPRGPRGGPPSLLASGQASALPVPRPALPSRFPAGWCLGTPCLPRKVSPSPRSPKGGAPQPSQPKGDLWLAKPAARGPLAPSPPKGGLWQTTPCLPQGVSPSPRSPKGSAPQPSLPKGDLWLAKPAARGPLAPSPPKRGPRANHCALQPSPPKGGLWLAAPAERGRIFA